MKILIDRDRCEGHGQCVAAAPDVVDLDDDGIAILRTSESIAEDLLKRAADVCPVAALTVNEG
jgi:ferredoxin